MVVAILPEGIGRSDLEEMLERGKNAGGSTHKLLAEWIFPDGVKKTTPAKQTAPAHTDGGGGGGGGGKRNAKRGAGGQGGGPGPSGSGTGHTTTTARPTGGNQQGTAPKRQKTAFVKGPVTINGVVYPHGCREDGWRRGKSSTNEYRRLMK